MRPSRSDPVLRALALAATLLVGAAHGQAQEAGARVDAGDVATVVLRIPAPQGVDSAHYDIHLDPAYRSFVPTEGRLGRLDDTFILPVTFATPRRLPAGPIVVGRARLVPDGASPIQRDLLVRVRERRDMAFVLETDELLVAPGRPAGIPFRVHNRGNLPDTVDVQLRAGDGWRLVGAPRLVVAPGDSALGVLRVEAPGSVAPGDRELVLVTARSAENEEVRTVNMVVVAPTGWLGGLAHVPSSLFVGQSLGAGGGPVVALSGEGRVGPETRVQVDLRHGETTPDPWLQRQVAGPRLRAVVTRPGLEVGAGDVFGFRTTVSGSLRQVRGIRIEGDPDGPGAFRAIAAVPTGFDGRTTGGHVLHGEADLATRHGVVSLLAGDVRYPARPGLAESRFSGAGLRWAGALGPHAGAIEATFVRGIAGDSLRRTGPAVDLEYGLTTDDMNARFRLRRVPDAATTRGGRGSELSGSFSARLSPDLQLLVWGFGTDQNVLASGSRNVSGTLDVGLRRRIGPVQLQLGGKLADRSARTTTESFDFTRRTVRLEGQLARGAFSLASDVEIGRSTELGRTGAYRTLAGSARWHGQDRWGWIRLEQAWRPAGIRTTSVGSGGSLRLDRVDLSGGVTLTATGPLTTASVWAGAEIRAHRDLAIHLGAGARPYLDADRWTFSVGFSRRLSLPLPVVREPDLSGVIFEDANDNGSLDPGERPIRGVAVALGYLETESDDRGRFAFRDAVGAAPRVRSAQLPVGFVISPRAHLPSRGRASIPLLRTATLHLDAFLDRDGDGERDPAESPAEDTRLILRDEQGRERGATIGPEGTARVSGLLPGRYTVTVEAAGPSAADPARALATVELAPGAAAHHTIAVPLHRRSIRMGDQEFPFFRQ